MKAIILFILLSQLAFADIAEVNESINQIPYKTDVDNWGKKDYWATPAEMRNKGAGDCEDYAIAKYFALLELGYPEKDMLIAYVSGKIPHMVLLVRTDKVYVLDNMTDEIKVLTNDFNIVYSFNSTSLIAGKVLKATQIKMWQRLLFKQSLGG